MATTIILAYPFGGFAPDSTLTVGTQIDLPTATALVGSGEARWGTGGPPVINTSGFEPSGLSVATRSALFVTPDLDTATSGALTPGQHAYVSAAAGAVTRSLPTGSSKDSIITVEKSDASGNAVSITGNIRGAGASTLVLKLQNELVEFVADSAGSWWPLGGHKSLASLDTRFNAAYSALLTPDADTALSGALTPGLHAYVTTGGTPRTRTLPTGTPLGQSVIVENADGAATLSVTGNIRGVGSSTVTLKIKESIEFKPDGAGSWWPVLGHKPLSSLDGRYVGKNDIVSSVRDSGALGDGSTDDTAAFQAAINIAIAAGGGTVLVEPANSGQFYKIFGQLNFESSFNVCLAGVASGSQSVGSLTRIYFYDTDVGIRGGSTVGLTLRSLALRKLNVAYTGVLISFDALSAGSDTVHPTIEHCYVGSGAPTDLGGTLVSVNRTQNVEFRKTLFQFAGTAIKRDPTLSSVNGQSNGGVIANCTFDRQGTASIDTPGAGWKIHSVFEPLSSGALASIITNPGTITSGAEPIGVEISGSWFGDAATGATGACIQARNWRGFSITGNEIQCGGGIAVLLTSGCSGGIVKGNDLQGFSGGVGTGIDFGSGGHSNLDYASNSYKNLATNRTGTAPSDSMFPDTFQRQRWHTGFYYGPPGVHSTVAMTLNEMYLVKIPTPLLGSVARLWAEVTTIASAGGILRLGLYLDDGTGVPGTLLVEATSATQLVTTAAAAIESTLGSAAIVPGDRIWVAGVSQVAACSVRTAGTGGDGMTGATNLANAVGGNASNGYGLTGVSGAMPGSITASSLVSTTQIPLFGIRAT